MNEIENAVIELLETYEDCMGFSKAIKSVGERYESGPEVDGFSALLDKFYLLQGMDLIMVFFITGYEICS